MREGGRGGSFSGRVSVRVRFRSKPHSLNNERSTESAVPRERVCVGVSGCEREKESERVWCKKEKR